MAIETSIVVEFGTDVPSANDVVLIELDPTNSNNLDSSGNLKSTFTPDDTPVFIINHSDSVTIDRVASTDGSVASIGNNITVEETESFLCTTKDSTFTIKYPNISTFTSVIFLGNTGDIVANNSVVTTEYGTYPFLCKATYNVVFQQQYMLTPPALSLASDETYAIDIVVYASIH